MTTVIRMDFEKTKKYHRISNIWLHFGKVVTKQGQRQKPARTITTERDSSSASYVF